ncbi:amino acid permease [Methylovirgula sp. 4M-Z18]|uniref:amino acid permease n=1 Tax=Methylovirgula sp. 4M-Z18 TaxID=2293567 RepID=UPI000E2E9023|nr:amino acid permease [Methylovirgula sp. 4M-Z18]RFB75689.1 amino acid permease [Methylovirgula sp. 4M-Z18]
MNDKSYTDSDHAEDVNILHSMGYAQELERRMSRFSNFAISFSIICILSGGINSLNQVTDGIGGIGIGLGWPVGCLISGVFAIAMAQISSAYPTAGGLYHWGSILGNRFTGWLTAWFNLIGLITVLGAINVGTWNFFAGAFGAQLGLDATSVTQQTIFVAVITAVQALVNHFGIRLTALLTDFSGYLIFAATIVLIVAFLAGAEHWDISRLWHSANYTGQPTLDGNNELKADPTWPTASPIWAFLLGLLLPIYTITGYDASAHTSEETLKASDSVPRAMIGSVLWSSLFGWAMLIAFLFLIPNLDDAAKQGGNVFFWALSARLHPAVVMILYIAIFISQWLCGLATVTSASRMIFAFSRDGGLPGSSVLSKVSSTTRSPVAAIWTAAISSVLFVWFASLVNIGNTSAYTIVVSCTVIFLFLSFTIPITLGMLAYGTKKWDRKGTWDLGGGLFKLVCALSILSMVLIFIIGVQPPNDWALYITVGFLVLTIIIWFAFENRRFKGPPIGVEVEQRQATITLAEESVGEI